MQLLLAVEIFTEAVSCKDLTRAQSIANAMTEQAKCVAREIWFRWVSDVCPF